MKNYDGFMFLFVTISNIVKGVSVEEVKNIETLYDRYLKYYENDELEESNMFCNQLVYIIRNDERQNEIAKNIYNLVINEVNKYVLNGEYKKAANILKCISGLVPKNNKKLELAIA